jgi:hypothetical protein
VRELKTASLPGAASSKILRMHAMTSQRRRAEISQGHGFPQNLVADQVAQGATNHNLDAPSQELFQIGGQAPREPWGGLAGNVNQEIHVALGRFFSPRYSAENPNISRPMASSEPQDFIPMFSDLAASVHNSILSPGRLRAGLHPHHLRAAWIVE